MSTLAQRVSDLAGAVRDKINAHTTLINGLRLASTALGYGGTGVGGVVTQLTSKATAVTLNKSTGDITLNAASLAAATIVSFTLNNSAASTADLVLATHHSGGTFGAYTIAARVTSAGVITISVRNNTAAALAEAIVIRFALIRGATA